MQIASAISFVGGFATPGGEVNSPSLMSSVVINARGQAMVIREFGVALEAAFGGFGHGFSGDAKGLIELFIGRASPKAAHTDKAA